MENFSEKPLVSAWPSSRPKGIKTADVKRLKRDGYSNAAICNKLGCSGATVSYHLSKRRKSKSVAEVTVKTQVETTEFKGFEAELFGTLIRLDQTPSSIERIGNRIVIK